MKHMSYTLLLLAIVPSLLIAASNTPTIQWLPVEPFPFKLSGYIKHESYWDTRQNVGIQDNEFIFYPKRYLPDIYCRDINAHGQFDMVPIQTRVRGELNGPTIKHAESLGVIEVDFFGKSAPTIPLTSELHGLLRVRHAFLQLTWPETSELLMGQTWQPLFVVGCEPRTVSFNTGAPFACYTRSPQVRFNYKALHPVELIATAFTQMDVKSDGPLGTSTKYLRDGIVPMLDGKIQAHIGDHVFCGADIQYKRIVPRLVTNDDVKTSEALNSIAASGYFALTFKNYAIRNQVMYTQNGFDITNYGGYAVHCINPTNDFRTYTNINVITAWSDMDFTKYKSLVPGLFLGYGKNLGASKTVIKSLPDEVTIYGAGINPDSTVNGAIDHLFRVSPRIKWTIQNFEFDIEVEYTRASYGAINDKAQVIDTTAVGNTRLNVSAFYYI